MELPNEEWELVRDDDFVYKRSKRLTISSSSSIAAPPPDPSAEERNRKERKKMTLLKLKTRYQKEIHHWELLSNTLQALQNPTQIQPPPTVLPDLAVVISTEHSSEDFISRELVNSLLIQVEAQEASIKEISRLCDVAEAICSAQEQLLNQPFIYLPIWESSPRKLITSLCEE